MYLFQLDTTERECFLDLAWHVVTCNGNAGEAEKEIFQSYLSECAMPSFKPTARPVAALLDVLKQSPKAKRRTVCIELFGIVLADSSYHGAERELMGHIGDAFLIGSTEMEQLKDWVLRFTSIIAEGQKLIQK